MFNKELLFIIIGILGAQKKPSIASLHSHLTTQSFAIAQRFVQLTTHPFLMFDDLIGSQTHGEIVHARERQQSYLHVGLVGAHGEHAFENLLGVGEEIGLVGAT